MSPEISVIVVSGIVASVIAIIKFVPSKPSTAPPSNGNRPVTDETCKARTEAMTAKCDTTARVSQAGVDSVRKEVGQLREDTAAGFKRIEISTEKGFDRLQKAISEK